MRARCILRMTSAASQATQRRGWPASQVRFDRPTPAGQSLGSACSICFNIDTAVMCRSAPAFSRRSHHQLFGGDLWRGDVTRMRRTACSGWSSHVQSDGQRLAVQIWSSGTLITCPHRRTTAARYHQRGIVCCNSFCDALNARRSAISAGANL